MTLWQWWPAPAVDADMVRLAEQYAIRERMDEHPIVRLAGRPARWWPAEPRAVPAELARERAHLWRLSRPW